MPTWQRAYLAATSAIIGYTLGYALSVFGEWPKATYAPYERTWQLHDTPPTPVEMPYVGIVLWGIGGALVAAVGAIAVTRFVRRELPARWLLLFGAWALTGFLLAGTFFTWNLWPF